MSNNIRNITIIAHVDHGKTTMIDNLMKQSGSFRENEVVDERLMDSGELEKERGITILAKPASIDWQGSRINIIDTPGLDDFIVEIASTMRVADSVVTVINAQHGVEIGTEIIWDYVDRFSRPTLFVINQIYSPNADFDESFKSIVELVGNNAIKIQYPLVVDGAQCIVDVLKMKMYKFGPEGGKPEKLEIPADQIDIANELHNELVEKAAENDEALMELYFDKGTLNEDEMRLGIQVASHRQYDLSRFRLTKARALADYR